MKKRIIIGTIIAVAVVAAVIIFYPKKGTPLATIKVTRGSIVETVAVTGATTPATSVELSFETTGRVTNVYANVADSVKAGDPLVAIDKSSLLAQLAQVQGGLDSAKANLAELKAGTRPEDIAIEEATVVNAQVAASNARQALMDAIASAYTAADDAGRNKTDDVFKNPGSANPELLFSSTNSQFISDAQTQKVSVVQDLVSWKTDIDNLNDKSDVLAAADEAQTHLDEVKSFLNELSLALNSAIITFDASQSAIDGWKADVSLARSSLNTAINALSAAASGMRGATATLTIQQNNLALKKAGSTSDQIAVAEAAVASAVANVQSVQVLLDKTVLRSPIDGIITRQDAKLGQIVTVSTSGVSNSGLVSIISPMNLEIDANIPETEIGKVSNGENVDITFDAFPGLDFKGTIKKIDPAETVVDGVVNYKVTVDFAGGQDTSRLKSGLTANLNITTSTKDDVLLLPQYAILQNDSGIFVRIPDAKGGTTDVAVKTGSRDQNGMVEIISGVSDGEAVVNVGLKQ
jgi:HlyD family secretion protein